MNQCSAVVIILTTGGVLLFFKRFFWGEMLQGDSADMCDGKFSLMSMGGRAEGLACADPGERTPLA